MTYREVLEHLSIGMTIIVNENGSGRSTGELEVESVITEPNEVRIGLSNPSSEFSGLDYTLYDTDNDCYYTKVTEEGENYYDSVETITIVSE